MNDKDVIISKGKESLKRLHANALALLDLTYIQESLDLFVDLLDFEPLLLDVLEQDLQIFAGQNLTVATFQPLSIS